MVLLVIRHVAGQPRPRSPYTSPLCVISQDLVAWLKNAIRIQATTVQDLAASPLPALILGEPGLPLTDVAEYLHARSQRPGKLDLVDCTTVSERAFEARVIKSLAPDRRRAKPASRRDTVCLARIDLLPAPHRSRLSKALDATGPRPSKRLLATSHRPASELLADAGFQDLYWSLALSTATLLPIRERLEDLPRLVDHILSQLQRDSYGKTFRTAAQDKLRAHRWPGNLAELTNVVRRALQLAVTAPGNSNLPLVAPEHITFETDNGRRECHGTMRKRGRPRIEIGASLLEDAQIDSKTGRSTRDIARGLGVSHTTAWRRLRDMQKASAPK